MREMGIMELDRARKAKVYERCLIEMIGNARGRAIRERMKIICKVLAENRPYYF